MARTKQTARPTKQSVVPKTVFEPRPIMLTNPDHIFQQPLPKINWNFNETVRLEDLPDAWSWVRNWDLAEIVREAETPLFVLDINAMREKCQPFAEELVAYVFHPTRMQNMAHSYGYELDEYIDYLM
jgi:hypothetical protein